jgi:tyrosine-protein kinase Etk/Wzc
MATREMDAGLSEPSTAVERRLDLLDVLLIFARRKWIILSSAAAFGIAAIIITILQPRLYSSTAVILPPQQEQAGSALLNQLGALSALTGGGGFGKSQAELYVSILQTNLVAQHVVDRFHLMDAYHFQDREGAAGILRRRSHFDYGKDGLIRISVEDQDPKRAVALAAGYADELFNQNNRLAIGSASQRRAFFQQQLAEEKDRLADAEVALKQTQQTTGVLQLSGQASNILRAEADLQANITNHEVQLAALLSSSTEQNPDVVRLRSELAGLRTKLSELQKGTGGEMLTQAQFPALGLEYVRREREVKYHETLFELLARQLEAARIDEAKATPTVQVVDPPLTPRIPSWPRPKLFLVIGLLLGVIFGCCLVAVLWLYDYVDKDPRLSPRFAVLKQALRLRA